MIYTHVLNRGPGAVRSLADSLKTIANEPHDSRSIELLPQYPLVPWKQSPW
jgi:hypothetical protein